MSPAERTSTQSAVGTSLAREDLLGARLVEAERERERVAAGVGNAVELADRRNVRLAVRAAQALGDVEDDVGALGAQPLGEIVARLEANHLAVPRERAGDGVDRLGGVPLGELVVRRRSDAARRPPRARRERYWAALRRRAKAPRPRRPPRARASGCTRNRCASSRPYCGIPLARARPFPLRAGEQVARHWRSAAKIRDAEFFRAMRNSAAKKNFFAARRAQTLWYEMRAASRRSSAW